MEPRPDTQIQLSSNVQFVGNGHVTLSDSAKNLIVATAARQLQNDGNIISGAGSIGNHSGLTLANGGVIDATGTNNLLIIDTGNTVNNVGVLEDTGAAGLGIEDFIDNDNNFGPQGIVEAVGAGAHVHRRR